MHCPECKSDNVAVRETRQRPDDNTVRRRRRCRDCSFRFTSVELIAPNSVERQRIYASIIPPEHQEERVIRIRGSFVIERPPAPTGAAGGGGGEL